MSLPFVSACSFGSSNGPARLLRVLIGDVDTNFLAGRFEGPMNPTGKPEILSEVVLYRARRGQNELRVTYTRANMQDGKVVEWHSIRLFYKGDWLPSQKGITVRRSEAHEVANALRMVPSDEQPKDAFDGRQVPFEALLPIDDDKDIPF